MAECRRHRRKTCLELEELIISFQPHFHLADTASCEFNVSLILPYSFLPILLFIFVLLGKNIGRQTATRIQR